MKDKKIKTKKPATVPTTPDTTLPSDDKQLIKDTNKILNDLLKRAGDTEAYKEAAEKKFSKSKEDFEVLVNILREYLDDFVVIGHTLEDDRVVIRYAKTPGEEDKLNELSKKTLIQMLMAEDRGE